MVDLRQVKIPFLNPGGRPDPPNLNKRTCFDCQKNFVPLLSNTRWCNHCGHRFCEPCAPFAAMQGMIQASVCIACYDLSVKRSS